MPAGVAAGVAAAEGANSAKTNIWSCTDGTYVGDYA